MGFEYYVLMGLEPIRDNGGRFYENMIKYSYINNDNDINRIISKSILIRYIIISIMILSKEDTVYEILRKNKKD